MHQHIPLNGTQLDIYFLLAAHYKDAHHLSLSNIGNNENYKYTYQTLDYFKQKYKYSEIYFICGTDNLDDFNNWKEYEYILKNYKLLVIRRNNDNLNEIIKKFENYKESIIITDVKMNNLSSTYIREKIRNEEKVLENLDEKVYSYIKENKLY